MTKEIQYIQNYLKQNQIDAYIIFTNDDHGSEYVMDYYKARAFLSGFTGSAGTMLITQTDSYLWTDGRYFLQAAEQLQYSQTKLMKMGVEGVLSLEQFIARLNDKVRIAFDFKLATVSFVQRLLATKKDIELIDQSHLIDEVWIDRPAFQASQALLLEEQHVQETLEHKLARTLAAIEKEDCTYGLISSLDDLAWLYNFRGNDVAYTPVLYGYSLISRETKTLYLHPQAISIALVEQLEKCGVMLKPYEAIYVDIAMIQQPILIDEAKTNYALYSLIRNRKVAEFFPTTIFKAMKNEVEIANMKKAHQQDAVAMIRFMKWVKENAGKIAMDELSVQEKLADFRKQSNALIDLSFSTICGYKENGAIIHYSATEKTNKRITNESLLLVDSGGQYRYGTTDITRTFVLGPITEKMKKDFTLVLKSHIALADAIFPMGANGYGLDYVCRMPMLKEYQYYQHGTGHGVGYLLSVHEGPQSINMTMMSKNTTYPILPGMITSDEPGIYRENEYGIRHESLLLTIEKAQVENRTFLGFEPISYVPFDLDGIDVSMLNDQERKWLNEYHQLCYKMVAPLLDGTHQEYLKQITRAI